jgi:hypothetical protein
MFYMVFAYCFVRDGGAEEGDLGFGIWDLGFGIWNLDTAISRLTTGTGLLGKSENSQKKAC